MITFSPVNTASREAAFEWHRSSAESDGAIFRRKSEEFKAIAKRGHLWCARDEKSNFVGMAYADLKPDGSWELGGLMVRGPRRAGIGRIIACLTLANLLVSEDPLSDDRPVIAHVLKGHVDPKRIIENTLRFVIVGEICEPSEDWPGLKSENGLVRGWEYRLDVPATLLALADWCRNPPRTLDDGGPAEILLPEEFTFQIWESVLDDMAGRTI